MLHPEGGFLVSFQFCGKLFNLLLIYFFVLRKYKSNLKLEFILFSDMKNNEYNLYALDRALIHLKIHKIPRYVNIAGTWTTINTGSYSLENK